MFITLEGIDGCGKTTQARMLHRWLIDRGRETLWTREPGDWSSGREIRSMVLGGALQHPMTELLLFLADRCEHVAQRILPALDQGQVVLCERYSDSTLAYQCWGRGISPHMVQDLEQHCHFPLPDVTLWLQVPLDVALRRCGLRGQGDRIEAEAQAFHQRVASGFAQLAAQFPGRIHPIDGAQDPEAVAAQICQVLEGRGL